VALQTEALPMNYQQLTDFRFLYMHGRSKFDTSPEELKRLRFNLETGGLLLADACCGKKAFDDSFRAFVRELFPKHKLERIPLKDELFSKELNGTALTEQNIRCRQEQGAEFRNVAPFLEGIKIDNRWV